MTTRMATKLEHEHELEREHELEHEYEYEHEHEQQQQQQKQEHEQEQQLEQEQKHEQEEEQVQEQEQEQQHEQEREQLYEQVQEQEQEQVQQQVQEQKQEQLQELQELQEQLQEQEQQQVPEDQERKHPHHQDHYQELDHELDHELARELDALAPDSLAFTDMMTSLDSRGELGLIGELTATTETINLPEGDYLGTVQTESTQLEVIQVETAPQTTHGTSQDHADRPSQETFVNPQSLMTDVLQEDLARVVEEAAALLPEDEPMAAEFPSGSANANAIVDKSMPFCGYELAD